jgi:hypothetical protein
MKKHASTPNLQLPKGPGFETFGIGKLSLDFAWGTPERLVEGWLEA